MPGAIPPLPHTSSWQRWLVKHRSNLTFTLSLQRKHCTMHIATSCKKRILQLWEAFTVYKLPHVQDSLLCVQTNGSGAMINMAMNNTLTATGGITVVANLNYSLTQRLPTVSGCRDSFHTSL